MSLLHELNAMVEHNDSSDANYIFAHYVLEHINEMSSISIVELADACMSSPSTISRMVTKVGCSSFKAFKSECAIIYEALHEGVRKTQEEYLHNGFKASSIDSYLKSKVLPSLDLLKQEDIDRFERWLDNEHIILLTNPLNSYITKKLADSLSVLSNLKINCVSTLEKLYIPKDATLIVLSIQGSNTKEVAMYEELERFANRFLLTTTLNKELGNFYTDSIQLELLDSSRTAQGYLLYTFMELVINQINEHS